MADSATQRSFSQRVLRGIRDVVLVVAVVWLGAFLTRTFIAQPFVVPTGSMQETIELDDMVLAARFGGFKRGDVVVFKDPGAWLSGATQQPGPVRRGLEIVGLLPDSRERYLVKRVIGMPGDRVRCCTPEGRLEINGHALDESAYIFGGPGQPAHPSSVDFDVVVPDRRIFVMGDHRNESRDSRCHLRDQTPGEPEGMAAFVPMDNVVGSTVAIIAPLGRFSLFHVPEAFATVPDPAQPAPREPQIRQAPGSC